jgi:protein TonB
MKDNLEPVLGFDELIFENRNKEYGAYWLRKRYNAVVVLSLIAASLIGISVVVVPFLNFLGKQHNNGSEVNMRYVQVAMDRMSPPEDNLIIPPPPGPPPPSSQPSVKYVAPVVVDSVLPIEKPMPSVAEVQASKGDTNLVAIASTGEQNAIMGDPGGEAVSDFFLLESRPTFKDGDVEKFREWVAKRVIYPKAAQDNGIQGRVYLTFIVERDGSVSNVKVVRGVDPLLDNEAIKAIGASPLWSPGKQRGNPVRVRFSIFLNFQNN